MDISYCTNCHNRLWQLKITIGRNLKFTVPGQVEIFVLAYNDETIEPYLVENYSEYINDGRLRIKSLQDTQPYSFGHVKNLCHSMAKGRVLFNLDADNYIDGCHEKLAGLTDHELLVTLHSHLPDGRGGRIGMTRRTFNELKGYLDNQESPDDDNLVKRAMRAGKRLKRAECIIAPLKNTAD